MRKVLAKHFILYWLNCSLDIHNVPLQCLRCLSFWLTFGRRAFEGFDVCEQKEHAHKGNACYKRTTFLHVTMKIISFSWWDFYCNLINFVSISQFYTQLRYSQNAICTLIPLTLILVHLQNANVNVSPNYGISGWCGKLDCCCPKLEKEEWDKMYWPLWREIRHWHFHHTLSSKSLKSQINVFSLENRKSPFVYLLAGRESTCAFVFGKLRPIYL